MKFLNFLISLSLLIGIAWAYHLPRYVVLVILFAFVFGLQIVVNTLFAVFHYHTKNDIKYKKSIDNLKVILLATLFFLLVGSMCGDTIENVLYHNRLW